jgi:hypothetical protein
MSPKHQKLVVLFTSRNGKTGRLRGESKQDEEAVKLHLISLWITTWRFVLWKGEIKESLAYGIPDTEMEHPHHRRWFVDWFETPSPERTLRTCLYSAERQETGDAFVESLAGLVINTEIHHQIPLQGTGGCMFGGSHASFFMCLVQLWRDTCPRSCPPWLPISSSHWVSHEIVIDQVGTEMQPLQPIMGQFDGQHSLQCFLPQRLASQFDVQCCLFPLTISVGLSQTSCTPVFT